MNFKGLKRKSSQSCTVYLLALFSLFILKHFKAVLLLPFLQSSFFNQPMPQWEHLNYPHQQALECEDNTCSLYRFRADIQAKHIINSLWRHFLLAPQLRSTLMNNMHYCVQKGGVGTMLGLFHGLLFSWGAGSPLPCNSEVKLGVHGSSMGVVKSRNTGVYKSTPSPLRGSNCICHFSPNPIKIMDS